MLCSSLDIPLRRDYRWFLSILCCIRIFPYDGHTNGGCKYFLDFSHWGAGLSLNMTQSVMYTMLFLRTCPYYGTVIFLCMVFSDHTGILMYLFSSSTSGARQGLNVILQL